MALALLLFFAWLLFPTDFVRHLPEKALSRVLPQWQWQIGSVHYGWPLALRLEQVEARSPGRGAEPVEALFIDSLTFWPDLFLYMREQEWRGTFAAELAGADLRVVLPRHAVTGATVRDLLRLAATGSGTGSAAGGADRLLAEHGRLRL